ncbi:hypothetical protein [Micromonospora sp. SL4-19]|uniref:hypothetical protein n=1 Tax=Micromonospora sp. SL4-19 TaxID=3399129 RepID=UPI003A4D9F42
MLTVKIPIGLAMLLYVPFVPIAIIIVTQLVGVSTFCRAFQQRAGLHHYLYLVIGVPFYQWLLAAAAMWAVVEHLKGNRTWHKTVHGGHHRTADSIGSPLSLESV